MKIDCVPEFWLRSGRRPSFPLDNSAAANSGLVFLLYHHSIVCTRIVSARDHWDKNKRISHDRKLLGWFQVAELRFPFLPFCFVRSFVHHPFVDVRDLPLFCTSWLPIAFSSQHSFLRASSDAEIGTYLSPSHYSLPHTHTPYVWREKKAQLWQT